MVSGDGGLLLLRWGWLRLLDLEYALLVSRGWRLLLRRVRLRLREQLAVLALGLTGLFFRRARFPLRLLLEQLAAFMVLMASGLKLGDL